MRQSCKKLKKTDPNAVRKTDVDTELIRKRVRDNIENEGEKSGSSPEEKGSIYSGSKYSGA